MDPVAQMQPFVNEKFRDSVRDAGYADLGTCLEIIGDWYIAQDCSGLSFEERARALNRMHKLFKAVFAGAWWGPNNPPGNVAGLPTRLWFALAGNVSAQRVLLQVRTGLSENERWMDQFGPAGLM